MRNYRVVQDQNSGNDNVHIVSATHYQPSGQETVTFYRRHPSSPQEGTPYNPEAPYFEPLQVAMFSRVISVVLVEEE